MPGKPGDVWRDILGADTDEPTDKPQRADNTPTERLQSAYGEPMKEYRVRLPETWWKALQESGRARGMKPSQVIRELVADYLQANRYER